ncbi:MAG: hypothetical protein Q9163_005819 [Psora crenata]
MTFDGYPYSSVHLRLPQHLLPPLSTPSATITAYAVIFSVLVYHILHCLDYTSFSLSGLLWNTLVCMTPSSLVGAFDKEFLNNVSSNTEEGTVAFGPIGHVSKSNAMRRLLGLEKGSVMEVIERTGTVSNSVGITKGQRGGSPPGLGNWDNSCYQNSVLQGMASLSSMPAFLASVDEEDSASSTKAALRDLTARLNNAENIGKTFWTPAKLKNMSSCQQQDAQEYFSKVLDEVDKDIAQGMRKRPRCPGLEIPGGGKRRASESGLLSTPLARLTQLPEELVATMARNPLEGLLAQRVGCQKCGLVEGLSLVPFNCLTVPLGKEWLYDVRACLDEFTALELINGVECGKCSLLQAERQLAQILETLRLPSAADGENGISQKTATLCDSVEERLVAVRKSIDQQDFSENALKKCQLGSKNRASTTKSKQVVIARPPKALVIHFNRSVFDEFTGVQSKNYAKVTFPKQLGIGPWWLGNLVDGVENWNTDPFQSLLPELPEDDDKISEQGPQYELRAVVTHYGMHENGHYICYRRSPHNFMEDEQSSSASTQATPWWRLSDEDVTEVSEETVLAQSGVFMLFYEQLTPPCFARQLPDDAITPIAKIKDNSPGLNAVDQELEKGVKDVDDVSYDGLAPSAHNMSALNAPAERQIQGSVSEQPEVQPTGTRSSGSRNASVPDQIAVGNPAGFEPTLPSHSVQVNGPTSAPGPDSGHETPCPTNLTEAASYYSTSLPSQPLGSKSHRPTNTQITPRSGRINISGPGTAMESVAGCVQAN